MELPEILAIVSARRLGLVVLGAAVGPKERGFDGRAALPIELAI